MRLTREERIRFRFKWLVTESQKRGVGIDTEEFHADVMVELNIRHQATEALEEINRIHAIEPHAYRTLRDILTEQTP